MNVSPLIFVSALTTAPDPSAAVEDLVAQVEQHATLHAVQRSPDLILIFLTADYASYARQIITLLEEYLAPEVLLGCTAEGVIGSEQEIEATKAITLSAAWLGGARAFPIFLQPAETDWHRLLLNPKAFRQMVDAPDDTRLFILLGDPFSTPMVDVLRAFNRDHPGIPIVGGMASGALRPMGNVLFINDRLTRIGAMGVALAGPIDVDVIVSQGCRPIWRPFRIQKAHRNVIYSLEGRPPLVWIQELVSELTDEDRRLLQKGLLIGKAIRPEQHTLGPGDYLIRGIVEVDKENGAIAISDSVMEGDIIHFCLRDALAAHEDLEMTLVPQAFRDTPSGGLLFACNGRGTRLYDHPNGDIATIQQNLNGTQVAGFFCAGEIGPLGGVNYLHGHTVSMALFRPEHFTPNSDNALSS